MNKRLYEAIITGDTAYFYTHRTWKKKRKKILKRDKYECQRCKREGGQSQAEAVHHILHLKDRPDLALVDDNLISLCLACHNLEHPEKIAKMGVKPKRFVNEERW